LRPTTPTCVDTRKTWHLKSNTSFFFFIWTYSAGVSLEGKQERWTNLLQSKIIEYVYWHKFCDIS
jgi:hypothetical protein